MSGTLVAQTIQGPSSGANANKVLIPSGHTLDVSGGTLVPSAGAVVQTIYATTLTGTDHYTTDTIVATALFASITPKYADSKIFVMVDVDHQITSPAYDCHLYLGRDNGSGFINALTNSAFVGGINDKSAIWNYRYIGSGSNQVIHQSPFGLFDAGQTSAITFKLFIGNVGGNPSKVGAHDAQRMILQEIKQ